MRIEWNGGKLTKKRALFLCWKLWEWLAENPGKRKRDWPEWKHNEGEVTRMYLGCPCCEVGFDYDVFDQPSDNNCLRCPLIAYWPKTKERKVPCEQPKSAFRLWDLETPRHQAKCAKRIAAAAKRRYEKL